MDGAIDLFAQAVMTPTILAGSTKQARRSQNFDGDPDDRDMGDFFIRMVEATDNEDIMTADGSSRSWMRPWWNATWEEWCQRNRLSIYLPTNGPDDLIRRSWTSLTSWTRCWTSSRASRPHRTRLQTPCPCRHRRPQRSLANTALAALPPCGRPARGGRYLRCHRGSLPASQGLRCLRDHRGSRRTQ